VRIRLALMLVILGLGVPSASAQSLAADSPFARLDDPGLLFGDPQSPANPSPPVATPEHTGFNALLRNLGNDFKALPSKPNVIIAGVGGGLALAVSPADDTLNAHLAGAKDFFALGSVIGRTDVQMGTAIAVYVIGRVTHEKKASHLGMDLLRAQIVSGAMTLALKVAVQRERPDGSDHYSFPSGHASITFATATVIYRHLGYRWYVPTYLVATYVGMSRLADNRHHVSDVVFGATVGVIAGRTVTRHGRSNYTWAPIATPGGVAVFVSYAPSRL
jgi:membrane-associated phospholipid phosphatase